MAELPQLFLTPNDMDRLLKLVDAHPGKGLEKLESELVRANVVPRGEIPGDVVTMNSRVLFENETTGERREVTLGEKASHGHLAVRAPASASSSRSRSRYCPYSFPFIARAAARTSSAPMVPIR